MLVLSRKRGETIVIGDKVQITIVRIGGETVRIGITAPKNVPILRKELLREIQGTEAALEQLLLQHQGPLEDDGGPASPPKLAGAELVPLGEDFA